MHLAIDAYTKRKERISREMIDLNAQIAQTNHEADVHNSGRPCTFSLDNPDDSCAAYDAETKRLEAAHAALRKKEQPVEAEKIQLETMRLNITSDSEAWDAAAKKNDIDYNDNEKEIGNLKMTSGRFKQQYDDCVRSQHKDRPEKMHEVCGNPLDGNIVHPEPAVNAGQD